MPVLILIRHGETDYVKSSRLAGWLPNVHLNEKGNIQARTLAENLTKISIAAVYSSPLDRTMETAEPIAKSHGVKVISREGLLETNYGNWQGLSLKALHRRKLWRVVQESPSQMRFPGGESFFETQLRICQELESISRVHSHKETIVCVTHSDPIRLAVAHYLGMPLDLFHRLVISPGSMTMVLIGDKGRTLLGLNIEPTCSFREHGY